jgi:hypothetical protein
MNREKTGGKLMFATELFLYLGILFIFWPFSIYVLAEIQLSTLAKETSLADDLVTLLFVVSVLGFLGYLVGMPLYWIRKYRKKE